MGTTPAIAPRLGSPSRAGFSLVWVLIVLAGMAAIALALTSGIKVQARQTALAEDATLTRIAAGLKEYIRSTQVIPGANTWAQAVAQVTGMNLISIRQVFPQFSSETRSRRIFLIDPRFQPNLGGSILPLTQPSAGLDPSVAAQVPNSFARVMILSSTKRGLTLPLSSGTVSAAIFDALWDWNPTPTQSDPPAAAALGSSWQGNASDLHVARVSVGELYSYLCFRSLSFATRGNAAQTSTGSLSRYFLQGTVLDLYASSNGALVRNHLVKGDAHFDFRSPLHPLGFWSFDEGTASVVCTNLGTAGAGADALLATGATVTSSTLQAPSYPGYASTNTSLTVDGVAGFCETSQPLLNGVKEFTLACWVKPASFPTVGAVGLCGQLGVAAVGLNAGNNLTLVTERAGQVSLSYPFPASEWHHVTVTGDGDALRIYLDGTIRTSGGIRLDRTDYGTSASPFRIGGGGIIDGTGNFFHGALDDVCLFDRALLPSEVGRLMQHQGPAGL